MTYGPTKGATAREVMKSGKEEEENRSRKKERERRESTREGPRGRGGVGKRK